MTPDLVEVAAGLAKDGVPGSAKAASDLVEDVAPGSLEVATLAAWFYLSSACPKIHQWAFQPPWEDMEVAPGLAEDVVLVSKEVASSLIEVVTPGSVEVASGSIEVVAQGSVEVASGPIEVVAQGSVEVANLVCLSLACPNICQSWPLQEDVAPDSVEVAAGLAKDVAPGSAKAASGLAEDVALGSVATLAACFYLSLACPKIR